MITVHTFILILVLLLVCYYCLDIRTEYPEFIVNVLHEPILRFICYFFIYLIITIQPVIGLILVIGFVTVHLDYLNLVKCHKIP